MKYIINGLIAKVEESILNLTIEQEKLLSAKQQYDSLQEAINLENETLEYLIRLKTGEHQPKIYRSLSNTNDFKKKKKLPWLSGVKEYLSKHGKPTLVLNMLKDITETDSRFISMKNKDLRKQVYYIQDLGRKQLSGLYLLGNGKIVLINWIDENKIIKPEYLQL